MREMKDSGVEWIGKIPSHWTTTQLKYVCTYNTDVLPNNTNPSFEFDYVDIGSVSFANGIEKVERMNFAKAPSRARRIVRRDDIVVSTVRTYLKAITIIPSFSIPLIVSTGFLVVRAKINCVSSSFLGYVLKSDSFTNAIEANSVGVSYPAIASSEAVKTCVTLPPIKEQLAIADFLDKKCLEIDSLTKDIQEEIEVLEKYKRSVISEAVTKGLDPNAPMKDSGIFYMQPVNANWRLTKIGYICVKLNRSFCQTDIALVCSNKGKVIPRPSNVAGVMVSEDHAMQGIHFGDIAIHGMDTWHGAIALSKHKGKITRVVHVCDSSEDNRFIVYYLQHLSFHNVYKLISNGVRENTSDFRSWDKVRKIAIAIPSIKEQQSIADFLDKKCSAIDDTIAKKKEQLEVLADYKKSLIYEYVTGKKEVLAHE